MEHTVTLWNLFCRTGGDAAVVLVAGALPNGTGCYGAHLVRSGARSTTSGPSAAVQARVATACDDLSAMGASGVQVFVLQDLPLVLAMALYAEEPEVLLDRLNASTAEGRALRDIFGPHPSGTVLTDRTPADLGQSRQSCPVDLRATTHGAPNVPCAPVRYVS